MRLVVIGGRGLIGTKLVSSLPDRGPQVGAASRNSGGNAVRGAGLGEALRGADVVVDVSNPSSFEEGAAQKFFETGGRNLIAAERSSGVRHHVALSVVGTAR